MASKTHVISNKTGQPIDGNKDPVHVGDRVRLVDDLNQQEKVLIDTVRELAERGSTKRLKEEAELWELIAKRKRSDATLSEALERSPHLIPALPGRAGYQFAMIVMQVVIAMLVLAMGVAYYGQSGKGDHPTLLRRSSAKTAEMASESAQSSESLRKGRAR